MTAAFEKRPGMKAFYYGNFNRDHTQWTSLSGGGAVRHNLRGIEESALDSFRGVFARSVQDARARHTRLSCSIVCKRP